MNSTTDPSHCKDPSHTKYFICEKGHVLFGICNECTVELADFIISMDNLFGRKPKRLSKTERYIETERLD
jgi:hypothetical protein